jgi:Domain of unknown function (DUF4386)
MDANHAQKLAKLAGVLMLISIFAGGFAEVYVPGKLLALSDPVATARNLIQHPQLFRTSFALYLVEAVILAITARKKANGRRKLMTSPGFVN